MGLPADRAVRADQPFRLADEFRDFIERCHGEGIGVIIDWSPAISRDPCGLANFDARHSMSTPTHAKAATRLGYVGFQLRPARSGELSSVQRTVLVDRYHVDGCGLMPSPPCFISTTVERRAIGFQIASAAAKTSKRSISCGA